jgi:hypothetical protein
MLPEKCLRVLAGCKRIVNNFKWAMNRTCYFWLAGSKHLPVLKDTAK